ncbi:uncharacterized protein LOC107365533 [Tetranychus urticae]|uniref:Uncharacterized protein n=1 Tax=Tetranychus urticae TaxID=32264 RepID=T1KML1_TETUR|nr:uncharacterized protein LOC107365533 [Tetranychus urticae]
MKSLLSNQVTWLTLTFGLVTMVNTIPVTINENNINQHSNHQPVNPTTSFNQKVILSLHQHLQPTLQPSTSSTSIATKLSSNQAKSHNPNHKDNLGHQQGSAIKRPERLKRSAMLLNKIVSALHKAMDNNKSRSNRIYLDSYQSSLSSSQQMDLSRRTGSKKMFRKCYFNPVACF